MVRGGGRAVVLVPWAKSEMRIPRVDARKALEQDARVNRVCFWVR